MKQELIKLIGFRIKYLILLVCIVACRQSNKEQNVSIQEVETVQDSIKTKTSIDDTNGIETYDDNFFTVSEDFSGEYQLLDGITYFSNSEENKYYKSAIIFKKLSDTDYGYYYVDKIKDVSPIGYHGVIRQLKGKFYNLGIKENDSHTNSLFIQSEVKLITKGNILGMISFGGNFKKFMWFKKMEPEDQHHISLQKTLALGKSDYQKFITEYQQAKNYENPVFSQSINLEEFPELTQQFFQKLQQFKDLNKESIKHEDFEAILSSLKTKTLPVIESTNFDDFIEAEDFKNLDYKALSLDKIYPYFNEEGYNFRAISAYKLDVSNQFYTLVVTIKKGDNEMESQLIDYDLNGRILDFKLVSYDEIAEGLSAIQSKITKDTVYRHHFFYEDEGFEEDYFQILENGNLGEIKAKNTVEIQNMPLVHHALHHLKLNLFNVKTNFLITKTHPNQPENRIVIIPEIEEEIEGFLALHTHILIINERLGTIKAKYFESSKTNQWISDAIRLDQIEIETTTYQLSDSVNAFGITAHYFGASKANPYYNKTLSLFVQSCQIPYRYSLLVEGQHIYLLMF